MQPSNSLNSTWAGAACGQKGAVSRETIAGAAGLCTLEICVGGALCPRLTKQNPKPVLYLGA